MSTDLTKKAIEMLLKGATLVSEPCPYCKGVRVIKNGHALCINCGKEPEIKENKKSSNSSKDEIQTKRSSLDVLEKKLEILSKELEEERNHEQQQHILKSINSLVEIITKLKKQE